MNCIGEITRESERERAHERERERESKRESESESERGFIRDYCLTGGPGHQHAPY
jgi:hypothetical protein